jgi:hypothetical protein
MIPAYNIRMHLASCGVCEWRKKARTTWLLYLFLPGMEYAARTPRGVLDIHELKREHMAFIQHNNQLTVQASLYRRQILLQGYHPHTQSLHPASQHP